MLRAENLKKSYGAFEVLKGINFTLKPQEILSLVGESGCGKSTAAKICVGMHPASGGEVFFEGKPLSKFGAKEWRAYRQSVQMVFQDPYSSLNPRWRIQDIIAEPLLLNTNLSKSERRKRVLEIMAQTGLKEEWATRYPHQFSGGQRQRVGIARALILKPKVLICDEPVSALDVSIQAQILNLLLDLQAQLGLSYLFISHDLGVVEHISDRILVMEGGVIVEEGSIESVLSDPKHPYTKKLLNAVPHLDKMLQRFQD
ncbi:Dipeptide ABC transporter ATP-binding protein DppF [Helicobacter sp. NHP19-003]|uniref:Dipeptide ABC transporter ATP-binding protein DppF n=1 Tax=Helicobacter gastrocanis TaxID=2849641 RepID=A0ABM7SBK5_9HELI|nr:ATP-binding cassette domain-containing protein [Helicobacter sp. NHP19-003]BCZ18046.1 Dipeptide ABC transporter ATP-binding protein DppF [Helicobacter sp. NHP19-003]